MESPHSQTTIDHQSWSYSQFATIPTATLSDAMDELDLPCVLSELSPVRTQQASIAGPAMTARFEPKTSDRSAYRFGGGVGKPLEQVLQTMTAGQVVVMDLNGATDASAWGGLASRVARSRSIEGTVINGACRDVGEIRSLGYGVWSRGHCPRRSRNSFTFGSVQEPIEICGVTVAPNDIIVADDTGVVRVPANKAQEIYDLAITVLKTEETLKHQIETNSIVDWDQM